MGAPRIFGLDRRLLRVCALVLLLGTLAGCGSSGPSREEVRGYLDSTYEADPNRSNTWLSNEPVPATADRISARVNPTDRFTESDAEFMRNREYIVAVFPEAGGSRVEFDSHERMYNRYPIFIGGYWGRSPLSYGPRGRSASRTGGGFSGGGFRGGGPGVGK